MGIIAKGEIHRRNWITAEFASASLMRNDVKMVDSLPQLKTLLTF